MVPAISVIVPARNAEATVGRTLAALAAQDFGDPFEVVFVDDASTDSTAQIARDAGVHVTCHETPHGPAGARNSGVAASRAPLLAFTDADCEPSRGWLTSVRNALEFADLVSGPVRPDPCAQVGPFDRTLNLAAGSPLFETANLAVKRETFDRVGGFESFEAAAGKRGIRPGPGDGHFGEDVVFGWRARRVGARATSAEAALVFHAVFPRGPRGYIRERRRLRFFPALVVEVPEMREVLPLGLFLSERTALFDLALGGVLGALVARGPWPLLAAVPYAHRYLRTSRPWRRSSVRFNLVVAAGDVVGAASLIRGSLAARRPVL